MQYISVEDFRKKMDKKPSYDSYLRRLCREGKLECVTEESEKGNPKYMINLQGKHAKKLMERSSNSTDTEFDYIGTDDGEVIDIKPEQAEESENIRLLIEELSTTRDKLVEFAQQAGQAKLLTDNLMTKEKDVKYWQDKYFEINNELKEAQNKLNNLQERYESLQKELESKITAHNLRIVGFDEKIERLQAELETERRRPFWKRGVI